MQRGTPRRYKYSGWNLEDRQTQASLTADYDIRLYFVTCVPDMMYRRRRKASVRKARLIPVKYIRGYDLRHEDAYAGA